MEWNGMEWNGMEWNGMEWKKGKNEAIVSLKTRRTGHGEGGEDSTKRDGMSSGRAEIPSGAGTPAIESATL